LQTFFAGRARDFAQQLMMPGMDAVEIADGHRHRLEPAGFL
jgi:cytochrome c peroxidase